MNIYDYSKLKGRIKEYFATQSGFAQKLRISDTSLSNKLNNKTVFDKDEIQESIEIFNLSPIETIEYFFTKKVDKISTK